MSKEEFISQLDLKGLQDRPFIVQEVCAYDGYVNPLKSLGIEKCHHHLSFSAGVKEGVSWLVDAMRKSKRTDVLRQRADAASLL